jgi:hypothetical protein
VAPKEYGYLQRHNDYEANTISSASAVIVQEKGPVFILPFRMSISMNVPNYLEHKAISKVSLCLDS